MLWIRWENQSGWRVTKQKRAQRGISSRKVLDVLNSADLQTGVPVQLGGQRKRGLTYSHYWENACWTGGRDAEGRSGFLRPMYQESGKTFFWRFHLWNKHEFPLFFFFFSPKGKQKLLSPAVMLKPRLCNRTWLQQMQKQFLHWTLHLDTDRRWFSLAL